MAVFTMSDQGESLIQVVAGETFAIRFFASPGTGFSWVLAAEPDGKLLAALGEKVAEPEGGRLGGRETVTWTFRALSAGETEISMKYARPWEKDVPPAKTYVFKVKIL